MFAEIDDGLFALGNIEVAKQELGLLGGAALGEVREGRHRPHDEGA